jgi:hypothetical protein
LDLFHSEDKVTSDSNRIKALIIINCHLYFFAELVSDYLSLSDTGGSISPLLGALYLHPLDEAMLEWERKGRILYRRFMDDFVILASSRRALRKAIRKVPVLFHLFRSSFFPRRAANNHRRLLLFWHIFLLHLRGTGCYSRRGCVLMFQLL